MSYRTFVISLIAVVIISLTIGYMLFNGPAAAQTETRRVTEVQYGLAYPVGHTFLCTDKTAGVARDWHFTDRWVRNQLSYDTYTVDGRVYSALHMVTDDPTLPKGHVRFRKVVVNIGTGPSLEGHSYLSTLINGNPVKMEHELLFVEFNGRLRSQTRPLPACGAPRR